MKNDKTTNQEIRIAILKANLNNYEVAEACGYAEASFYRKMREQIPEEETNRILSIIDNLVKEKGGKSPNKNPWYRHIYPSIPYECPECKEIIRNRYVELYDNDVKIFVRCPKCGKSCGAVGDDLSIICKFESDLTGGVRYGI